MTRSVVELADRPVSPRRAALVYALLALAAAAVAHPLAQALHRTAAREPRVLAALRQRMDPEDAATGPGLRSIIVVVDGLRRDEAARLTALRRLGRAGVRAEVELPLPTMSTAFYHAFMTGTPPAATGVRINREGTRAVVDSLPDRVRAGGGTVAWVTEGLDWLPVMFAAPEDSVSTGPDTLGAPLDRVLGAMADGRGPTLAVVHVLAVDETAHDGGIHTRAHAAALVAADAVIERVARMGLDSTLVCVVSDHGHIDRGGHGGDEPDVRRVPLVLAGAGVPRLGALPDPLSVEQIAPTLSALMGVQSPRAAVAGPARAAAPPEYAPPAGPALRAAMLTALTAAEDASRRSARLPWLGAVLFLSLCALGATKRAFGGFDLGSGLAPVLLVGAVLAGHLWILGRPLTLSAIDGANRHGVRLALLGATAALCAIASGTLLGKLVGHRAVAWPERLRRASAASAWFAVTVAAFSVAWVGGALGPWPLGAAEHYAPILSIATGAGACVVAAVVLLGTLAHGDRAEALVEVPRLRAGGEPMKSRTELDQLAVDTIRTLSMDAVQAANSGHPGTPMALAPVGWTVFSRLRRHDPTRPEWPDRDRFVLSCGHASMLQYSLLHLTGYDLPLSEIEHFRQWGSRTPGHPEHGHTPGVEITTGPLGQGFATAVGMAMAEKHLAMRFNREGHTVIDHHTWVLASDGDMMEGVCAEAASLAGHLGLGKLVVFWDDNRITIDGGTELCFSEDTAKRFEAYGWHVQSVPDGNDLDAIEKAALAAKADPRPSLVRLRTIIGYPAPHKQNTSAAHGAPLGEDEIAATKKVMGWSHPKFHVPPEMARAADDIRARGSDARGQWEHRLARYRDAHAALARELEATLAGRLPAGWDADLPTFPADAKGLATRQASGKVIAALAARLGGFVGGSADLAGSNNTYQDGLPDFHDPEATGAPRNVHWGIREHAMAAAVNGMALHGGVIPYGATFLIFSDYMRPALRLGALMNVPARHVFTHDSIGLGEDGPTHQPVEQIAALRAIPNMTVIRPADANEVTEAWRVALGRPGPVALVLTRQALPTLDRASFAPAAGLARGAYVLADAEGGDPQAVVIGTGSEVSIALEARRLLADRGVRTRVVNMPSWELFEEQDDAYRDSVLGGPTPVRVVVEAAVRFGWERWVGANGGFVTLDRFGASAPAKVLYEKLGITPAAVVAEVERLLGR